jgi:hypothetical protein
VRIRRHGAEGFCWEICRDDIVIRRSTRLFPTRMEALIHAAQAAAYLETAFMAPSVDA